MRITLLFFILLSSCIHPQKKEKPTSYGLITYDYGILTKDDLGYDVWRGNPRRYDPVEGNYGYYYWQCFPIKNIKPKVRTWRDADPMGPSNVIVTMCDLEVHAKNKNELHVYAGRRAKEVTYCNEFMKNWKKLIKNEEYICISGEGGGIDKSEDTQKDNIKKVWTWDKIKSKKGCYSYFGGECDPEYWKSQGYPNFKP